MSQNKFLKLLESLDDEPRKLLNQCMQTDLIKMDPKVKNFIRFCLENQFSKPDAIDKRSLIQEFDISENAYNNYIRKAYNYLKAFLPIIHPARAQSRDFDLLDYYSLKDLTSHFESYYKSFVKKPHGFRFQERIEMYLVEKYAVHFDIKNKNKIKTDIYVAFFIAFGLQREC